MTTLKAFGDRIIIRRIEVEEKSKGGIILTPQNTPLHHSKHGRVISVGGKVRDVAEGDHVIFKGWNKADMTVDGVDYICMTEADIIGVVPDEI